MLPELTANPYILQELFDRLHIGCIIFELTPQVKSFYNADQEDISILDLKDHFHCTVVNKVLGDTLQLNPIERNYTLKDWLKDFPEAIEHLEICQQEKEMKFCLFFERLGKNGAWIEGEYIQKFNQEGEFQGLMGIFRDITLKKKLEKKVTQEKRKLEFAELVLDISQKLAKIGTWRFDLNSKDLVWSDALHQMFDLPPEMPHLHEAFMKKIHPEDKEHFSLTFEQAIETKSSYTIRFRVVKKNSEILFVSGNGHPILCPEGNIVGYFGLFQDISDLKNAQIELEKGNRDLEGKVAERTKELELSSHKMREVLEQLQIQNELLQQYTYIVSHNLRAPIANISGLTELFDFEDSNCEENKEILLHIYKVSKHLDHIIKDLNEILSADGKIEKAKTELNLYNEIERVCEELNAEILNKNARVRIVTPRDFTVIGVKGYIFSILHNLVENALKYQHADRQTDIEIGSHRIASGYSIWVKDNGIGIDLPKNEGKLFKLHSRLGGMDTSGMGMGLFLVKTHVDQLGGEILVESTLGEGTNFTLLFPN